MNPQEGRFPWLDCPPSQVLRDDLEEFMRRILYLDSPHGGTSLESSLRDTAAFLCHLPCFSIQHTEPEKFSSTGRTGERHKRKKNSRASLSEARWVPGEDAHLPLVFGTSCLSD